jgi:hypothetical protein
MPVKGRGEVSMKTVRLFKACIAAMCFLMSAAAWGQGISYDPATSVLTISSVQVGSATYINVTLLNIGSYTFKLQGATLGSPGAGLASYDTVTSVLTLPSVAVGTTTYNVTMLNTGNYTFTLQSASVVSTGGGSGTSSACYNPAFYANGTTSDLFYQDLQGTTVVANLEVQSVVQAPQIFTPTGQSAIAIKATTIDNGKLFSVSTVYYQLQYPILYQLGNSTSTGGTNTFTPPIQDSYALSPGQSIATSSTLTNGSTSFAYKTTYTFDGQEDVTVPAGTFTGTCKWTSSVNGGTPATQWLSQQGILVKNVQAASTLLLMPNSTFNGAPVTP